MGRNAEPDAPLITPYELIRCFGRRGGGRERGARCHPGLKAQAYMTGERRLMEVAELIVGFRLRGWDRRTASRLRPGLKAPG